MSEKIDPVEGVELRLEESIYNGATMEQVAEIWASVMALPGPDFLRMNRAVEERWPNSLGKIKAMAWRIYETGSPRKKQSR